MYFHIGFKTSLYLTKTQRFENMPNIVYGQVQNTPQPLYNTIVGVHSINRVSFEPWYSQNCVITNRVIKEVVV